MCREPAGTRTPGRAVLPVVLVAALGLDVDVDPTRDGRISTTTLVLVDHAGTRQLRTTTWPPGSSSFGASASHRPGDQGVCLGPHERRQVVAERRNDHGRDADHASGGLQHQGTILSSSTVVIMTARSSR